MLHNIRITRIIERTIHVMRTKPIAIKGICDVFHYLLQIEYITFEEYVKMKTFLLKHKPTIDSNYKEFMQNEFWNKSLYSSQHSYWWQTVNVAPETEEIRIAFLKTVMANLK